MTGFPNYPAGKIFPGYRIRALQKERVEGLAVTRLALYPSHDASSAGRMLNYISFFLSALIYGLWSARRFDVIYVYHPPITVGTAAALFSWVWRKPFIVDIQDLWPDSVAASGMRGTRVLARILGALCQFVYWRAAVVVAQSKGIRDAIVARGTPPEKMAVIFNWADEALTVPSEPPGTESLVPAGKFNIVFGGNIGFVQGLDEVAPVDWTGWRRK